MKSVAPGSGAVPLYEQFIAWEMAQNHWADTTREALSRNYGNGETVRRSRMTAGAAGALHGSRRDFDGAEVPRHIGLLLIWSTKVKSRFEISTRQATPTGSMRCRKTGPG